MSNEQIQVVFHNKAKEIFFSTYNAFENAVSNLNRKSDEYRFQQVKKQYVATLEQQLQTAAKDVLTKYPNEKQSREVDQMIHQFIKDYLHRFIQKVNAL